jgi:hypothetical protein
MTVASSTGRAASPRQSVNPPRCSRSSKVPPLVHWNSVCPALQCSLALRRVASNYRSGFARLARGTISSLRTDGKPDHCRQYSNHLALVQRLAGHLEARIKLLGSAVHDANRWPLSFKRNPEQLPVVRTHRPKIGHPRWCGKISKADWKSPTSIDRAKLNGPEGRNVSFVSRLEAWRL